MSDDPSSEWIFARSRIVDVGSPQALALAKKNLDECVHSHQECLPLIDPAPFLPTRLIDCTDPNHPRLVETSGLRGPYAALSYVWGEDQSYKTTTSNYSSYLTFINPTELKKTVCDAIHTTNALGIQYLWIDTLCIIQDSSEDKLRELVRMGRIYRDAYVTIIAASAPRVSVGFLEARPDVPPSHYPPDIEFPFICPPSSDPKEHARARVGKVRISPVWVHDPSDGYDHWWSYYPETEPVHARGWCMQEYAMSPRALVFASHTVQYHCRTGGVHNVGGSHNDHPDRDNLLPSEFFAPSSPPRLVRHSPAWKSARHAWQAAIEDYTRRAITLSSDKLVAFGGVAEAFQHAFGGDYLAGL